MKTLLFILIFASASYTKNFAQKSNSSLLYTHNFPPEMSEEIRQSYIKLFEKGRILYQINCGKCHNTKVKGFEIMPEFTKEHLAQYELRIQNPKHEEELSEMKVNAEELQQIMIFLTYYKKTAAAIKLSVKVPGV